MGSKGPIDYGWIVFLGIAIVIVIFWKQIFGLFTGAKNGLTNKAGVDRGKIVFNDANRWGNGASCAACHDPAYKKPPEANFNMPDFHPGQPLVLKGINNKFGSPLNGQDKLMEQLEACISLPARLNAGKVSAQAPFIQDLIAYVRTL